MKPSEETRLGKTIVAAQEHVRLSICKTGAAAPWHLAKAASVVRKPKLLERIAPHLEGDAAKKYLASLADWVEQTRQQDAKCADFWQQQRSDYTVQRDHLVAMLLRYDFSLRSYEKLAREWVHPTGAEGETPPPTDVARLSANELTDLMRRIEADLEIIDKARAELVAGNEELIVKLTQKNASPEEATPYARFGLAKAAENFDVRRGHRFTTYAQWWIKTAIEEKKTWESKR
jgi:DNA-directed RNA polymerase sigma subunit (sigma70/sigma32)